MTKLMTSMIAVLFVTALAACERKDRSDETIGQTMPEPTTEPATTPAGQPEVDSELERERAEFVRDTEARIDQIDREVAQWESGLDEMSEEARQDANEAIESLREERERANAALSRARDASADEWAEIKKDSREALAELENAYNETLDTMKTN